MGADALFSYQVRQLMDRNFWCQTSQGVPGLGLLREVSGPDAYYLHQLIEYQRQSARYLRGPNERLGQPDQCLRGPNRRLREPDEHLVKPNQDLRKSDQLFGKSNQCLRVFAGPLRETDEGSVGLVRVSRETARAPEEVTHSLRIALIVGDLLPLVKFSCRSLNAFGNDSRFQLHLLP